MDATANYLLTEKMKDLDKTATDMAQKALSDFKKALPADDRDKGLELFNIVNQSMKTMKKQKKVKKRRVNQVITKPTLKTGKQKMRGKKHNNDIFQKERWFAITLLLSINQIKYFVLFDT